VKLLVHNLISRLWPLGNGMLFDSPGDFHSNVFVVVGFLALGGLVHALHALRK
jgi:hypothetical protein